MRVLTTGADGMLGSHICRELLRQNHDVRALVQPDRRTGTLAGLDIEIYQGDILDNKTLLEAMKDCDAVIHAAATTQIWPSRSPLIWEINYEGTKLIAKAVREAGLMKFVHIGTANSFGPGSKIEPGTELCDYADYKFNLDYQDSKRAAQDYLCSQARSGLPVCVINPGFMFGAYDSKPGSGAMVISIYQGKMKGFTKGGRSFVAAKDVAVCAVNALKKGKTGECYLATGVNLNFQEISHLIAKTIGVPPPKLPVPDPLADLIGITGSLTGALFKKPPLISYPMARLSHTDCYYSNQKAVLELDMPQTPLEEAILDCFIWFKLHNYV